MARNQSKIARRKGAKARRENQFAAFLTQRFETNRANGSHKPRLVPLAVAALLITLILPTMASAKTLPPQGPQYVAWSGIVTSHDSNFVDIVFQQPVGGAFNPDTCNPCGWSVDTDGVTIYLDTQGGDWEMGFNAVEGQGPFAGTQPGLLMRFDIADGGAPDVFPYEDDRVMIVLSNLNNTLNINAIPRSPMQTNQTYTAMVVSHSTMMVSMLLDRPSAIPDGAHGWTFDPSRPFLGAQVNLRGKSTWTMAVSGERSAFGGVQTVQRLTFVIGAPGQPDPFAEVGRTMEVVYDPINGTLNVR